VSERLVTGAKADRIMVSETVGDGHAPS